MTLYQLCQLHGLEPCLIDGRGKVRDPARAFRWQAQIEPGQFRSVQALAHHAGVDEAYVRRTLRLCLIKPCGVDELLCGTGTRTPSDGVSVRWRLSGESIGFLTWAQSKCSFGLSYRDGSIRFLVQTQQREL